MLPRVIKNEADIREAMKYLLLDDFSVYGDDASLFAKTQKQISDNTYSVVTPMRYVRVLSMLPEKNQPQDGRIAVYAFEADGVSNTLLDINLCMGNYAGLQKKNGEEKGDSEKAISDVPDASGTLKTAISKLLAKTIPETSFYPMINGQPTDNKEAVEELKRTRLMFQAAGKTYIVSQFALPTLGQRLELKGRAMLEPCLERDIYIAKRMQSRKNVQFIVKSANGLGKIFMAASESYKPLPLTAIERIYHIFGTENGIGKMRCEGWEIDHSVSRIRFSFLDYKKTQDMAFLYGLSEEETAIPGLEIISSDIGDYAFTIRGFWKLKRGYLYVDEVSRKHSGDIDEAKVVDEVKHTIFERYTLLPNRFMELLEIDITPGSVGEAASALSDARQAAFDAETACGDNTPDDAVIQARKNLEKAEKQADRQFKDHEMLLREIVKKVMKEITTGTLQYKKDWIERVAAGLSPDTSYTAYDIMTLILDTQIMKKSDETVEKMRKSMTKLPYLEYDKFRDAVIDKFALFRTRKKAEKPKADEAEAAE